MHMVRQENEDHSIIVIPATPDYHHSISVASNAGGFLLITGMTLMTLISNVINSQNWRFTVLSGTPTYPWETALFSNV